MKKNSITRFAVIALTLMALACGQQTSVSNPAPVGESRNVGGDVSLTILDVILPADNMVSEPIKYSETSPPNSEYAIIKLRIQCNNRAHRCGFSPYSIHFADHDGNMDVFKSQVGFVSSRQPVKAYIPDELDLSADLLGGDTVEGNVLFLVSKDINYAMIIYRELYGSPSYFAMP